MKTNKAAISLFVLAGLGTLPILAQDATTPSPVISVTREFIKEGKGYLHEKSESDWAALLRRSNFPGHYLGLAAMSGGNEAWFISTFPSFAASEEFEKAGDKEPLKSAQDAINVRDAEMRTGSTTMWAVYAPDISYKPEKFNRGKVRFVAVRTFRVRLGHDEEFRVALKTYFDTMAKVNGDLCILGYQVTAGASAGTYLFFNVMDSMKTLDGNPARTKAVRDSMGSANYSKFLGSVGDMLVSQEDMLLEVKPGLSYVSQATMDVDPDFWKPKAAAKAMPTAAGKKKAP